MIKKFNEFINESTSFNNEDLKIWIVDTIDEWSIYDDIEHFVKGDNNEYEKSILVWIDDIIEKIVDDTELTKNDLISVIIYLRHWFDNEDFFSFETEICPFSSTDVEFPTILFEYDGLSEDELKDVIIEIYNYINDNDDSKLRPAQKMGLL